ncbi:hypothetical protein ACH4OX_24380 [Streptomyces roseolus]|uniref:hypothetical protein n=1 Tax=Streptomyces roseolus TaxID=67358 RepID=UPI0037B51983
MQSHPEADTLELPPVPQWGRGRPRLAAQRIHPRRISIGHLKLYGRARGWALAEGVPARGRTAAGRFAGLAVIGLGAWRPLIEEPKLLALSAGAYLVAAWRAARPVPPTREELRRELLLGVRFLIGDRPGIHLRELYDAFQARPAAAHLTDARIRALLVECGVPIHKSLRIGEVTGRSGIKAAEVETLLPPTPAEPPSDDVDAGQTPPEEAVDQPQKGRRPRPQKELYMANDHHDITVRGRITLPGDRFVTCPECGTADELTIYGPDGGAGHLMCPAGHHFAPPAPIDPVELLARAVADPRTTFLN